MADMVWLEGVRCRCRVGVPEAERRRPQAILLDVGLEVDAGPAAERDDLSRAVDYWAVERLARRLAETGQRRLLETLASRLAEGVLAAQPLARAVVVRASKRPAVMPRTARVSVVVRRARRRRARP